MRSCAEGVDPDKHQTIAAEQPNGDAAEYDECCIGLRAPNADDCKYEYHQRQDANQSEEQALRLRHRAPCDVGIVNEEAENRRRTHSNEELTKHQLPNANAREHLTRERPNFLAFQEKCPN